MASIIWDFLHTAALYFNKFSNDEKFIFKHTIVLDLACVLPCEECISAYHCILNDNYDHFQKLEDQYQIFSWTVDVHNSINIKLKKPLFSNTEALSRYVKRDSLETSFDPITLGWDLLLYHSKSSDSLSFEFFDKLFELFLQPMLLSYLRLGWKTHKDVMKVSNQEFVKKLKDFFFRHPFFNECDERESILEIEHVRVLENTEAFSYDIDDSLMTRSHTLVYTKSQDETEQESAMRESVNPRDPFSKDRNTEHLQWPIVDVRTLLIESLEKQTRVVITSYTPVNEVLPSFVNYLCELQWNVNICLYEAKEINNGLFEYNKLNNNEYFFVEPCGLIKKITSFLKLENNSFIPFNFDEPFNYDITLEICFVKQDDGKDIIDDIKLILLEHSLLSTWCISHVQGFLMDDISIEEKHNFLNQPFRNSS